MRDNVSDNSGNIDDLLASLFGNDAGGHCGIEPHTSEQASRIIAAANAWLDDPANVPGDVDVRAPLIEGGLTSANVKPDWTTEAALRALADALAFGLTQAGVSKTDDDADESATMDGARLD